MSLTICTKWNEPGEKVPPASSAQSGKSEWIAVIYDETVPFISMGRLNMDTQKFEDYFSDNRINWNTVLYWCLLVDLNPCD